MEGLAITGVTASGKSSAAVVLAERLGGEIISCDSMLVYRGCDIGTAKPTAVEMRGIPHHLIDIKDPSEQFTAADFASEAGRLTSGITKRGRLPIICGGTGLYLDAFLRGGIAGKSASSPERRAMLEAELKEYSAEHMHRRLEELDPAAAKKIHANNTVRVIRAIEIFEETGMTKTDLDAASPQMELKRDWKVFWLDFSSREYARKAIAARIEKMFSAGLAEETSRLRKEGVFESCSAAAAAIGYKELFPYLDGKETEEEAKKRLETATCRYLKRQETWFKKLPYATRIEADVEGRMKKACTLADEIAGML